MISALAGLPSLGGIGGGFDGGSLPLLGFGLLSTFASSLTTQSFLGSTTSIPDLNSQANINFGNFNSNFGSYTGNGSNGNGYFYNPAPYGDNPSLHTGPSDFRAWHQWATGGVQPPLCVEPFYGQGYGYTNVQFGSAGAYGAAAGYGSPGVYGTQGAYGAASVGYGTTQGAFAGGLGYGTTPVGAYPYSASPAYCPPTYGSQPIFSSAYQAMGVVQQSSYTPVQNYTPIQTYIPPSNYTIPPQNYTPPAPPNYSAATYGTQPTPEQTANFNNYAQEAIARFNSNGASITGTYQGATGMQAPGYTPATYAAPDYSQPGVANPYYGQPTPEQTANFNNYAQEALARFNSTGASINGQYAVGTGMAPPSYTPATYGYGGQPTPQQTASFNNYAQEALARLNATSASIQGTYQASFASSSVQVNYGSDITYSLPAQQTPAYGSYLGNYQSLPNYGAASYGAYNLGWSYPQPQPPVFYGSALPSYTAPLIQSQTPYGYGGPPLPAPCPPPAYPPRPPHQHQHPPYQPPTQPTPPTPPAPPARDPKEVANEQAQSIPPRTGNHPGRIDYPVVPIIQQDVAGPASVLGSRLTGDPSKIASFTVSNPAPNQNNDANHFDRIGAYMVMQQDSSLRYNVDTGRFFRTYDGGVTRDVLDMAQVSQMVRQDHPDNFTRVGQLLQHLPNDNQLFGSQEQGATPSGSFAAGGATQTNGGFVPPPRQPLNLPPLNTPTLPPFAGFGNSGGKVPALDALVAQRESGQISGNDFNLALLQIAAQQGALNPNPQPQTAGVGFQITAHRYWDPQRGDYANVSDVTTQGYEGEDQHIFNTQNQTSVTVSRDGVPPGTPVRVTVNWDNGQSRTWDYQVGIDQQSDVDVFSPIG